MQTSILLRGNRHIAFLATDFIRQNSENYNKSRYREKESHDEKRSKAVAFLSCVMGGEVCESQFRQNDEDKPHEKAIPIGNHHSPFLT